MVAGNVVNVPETVPTKAEKVFLGLVREGMMRYYVGRGAELTDEELRSLFGLAVATLRKSDCLKGFDDSHPSDHSRAESPTVTKKSTRGKAAKATESKSSIGA